MVDLGMTFVDNWVAGKEKVCHWLSNDFVGLVGTLALLKHHPQRCHCFVASVVEGGVLGSFECCFWCL